MASNLHYNTVSSLLLEILKILMGAKEFKDFRLVGGTRFDAEKHINHLSTLSEYALNEHQFAQLTGKSKLYQYLPPKTKKAISTAVPISDSQISTVGRDYYQDKSFCRSESGDIDMWKAYNLFAGATKSSYIDTFLDRNVGSLLFIKSLVEHLRDKKQSWFLT